MTSTQVRLKRACAGLHTFVFNFGDGIFEIFVGNMVVDKGLYLGFQNVDMAYLGQLLLRCKLHYIATSR